MAKNEKNGKKFELNTKEKKVLKALVIKDKTHLSVLATEAFNSGQASKTKGNSWARNSLRRLMAHELVKRVGEGTYEITAEGRALAKDL